VSVLISPLLASLNREHAWLDHGFGTRSAALDQTTMASLKQIHSSAVLLGQAAGCAGEGDALVTRVSGLPVSVRTADCFPILLADPETRAVAAIHAGWRGTAARILPTALARMNAEFGTDPRNIHAAIGPGIGKCCYEVGDEVSRQFGMEQRGKLDLAVENTNQLIESGVEPAHIDRVGGCTFCNAANFFSWRRDRERAGRMISFISRLT
jgi:polyphenol oxidase